MRWGAPVLVAAALCGCSAEPDPVAPVAGPITLECGQGFEALARAINSSSTIASRRSLSQAARRFSGPIPLAIPISSSGPAG